MSTERTWGKTARESASCRPPQRERRRIPRRKQNPVWGFCFAFRGVLFWENDGQGPTNSAAPPATRARRSFGGTMKSSQKVGWHRNKEEKLVTRQKYTLTNGGRMRALVGISTLQAAGSKKLSLGKQKLVMHSSLSASC